MRVSATFISLAAALSGRALAEDCATAPIAGPFYINVVPKDGSSPYKTSIESGLNGVEFLNPSSQLQAQFIWKGEEKGVYDAEHPDSSYSALVQHQGDFYFIHEGDENQVPGPDKYLLQQQVSDCAVYLVKEGTTAEESVFQWAASPPGNSPYEDGVLFYGSGSKSATAALRVETA